MLKSYKSHSFANGLRYSCSNAFRANKGKLFLTFTLILVAIITGVFVALKSNNNYQLGRLQEINLENFYTGFAASSSAFFSRCFSLVINVTILVAISFSPFLFPLAQVLFVYRAYLFGLNFALIFVFYGVGSMITAVVVILPCQMATIFALVMFYIILKGINSNCKRFGGSECNRLVFIMLGFVTVLLLNLIETLLLCFLNGKVILVI